MLYVGSKGSKEGFVVAVMGASQSYGCLGHKKKECSGEGTECTPPWRGKKERPLNHIRSIREKSTDNTQSTPSSILVMDVQKLFSFAVVIGARESFQSSLVAFFHMYGDSIFFVFFWDEFYS